MNLFRVIILVSLFIQPVLPQSKKITQHREDLKQIRSEIDLYKNRLLNESAREKSILDMLSALDREIDVTQALLEQLKQEEKKNSRDLLEAAHELNEKRDELEHLKEIYKQRMIHFYKHGRVKDLELLLAANSFNQVLVWVKYQKLLAENDRRNFQNILDKKQAVEDLKDRRKNEVLKQRRIIKEKTEEEKNLRKRKKERERLLSTVRQNKQLYAQKLKEYEIAAREIERLIFSREEKRLAEGDLKETKFPKLRGKMIWPARGTVITKFGKYRHPQLKTITESIGIDIRANLGDEVRSVGSGVVTAITWQRGRGNIVIVNHFGGYYTVYTHLSKINVKTDQQVSMGQVLGEVGDSGSLKGPMLHFEIWQNNKVLDPMSWLS
ncbi:peptidoglycan DD-metalloendopeptidase family protein [candidate division KSB1 bacterium]|nr:peptidoglycan DD-metalloendopeptidase family protein [candidate division KSB1 bacterium]